LEWRGIGLEILHNESVKKQNIIIN
jgi:hypothetical protein